MCRTAKEVMCCYQLMVQAGAWDETAIQHRLQCTPVGRGDRTSDPLVVQRSITRLTGPLDHQTMLYATQILQETETFKGAHLVHLTIENNSVSDNREAAGEIKDMPPT